MKTNPLGEGALSDNTADLGTVAQEMG